MDFGQQSWDVSQEADNLASSLFSGRCKSQKKAKKRKSAGNAFDGHSEKKVKVQFEDGGPGQAVGTDKKPKKRKGKKQASDDVDGPSNIETKPVHVKEKTERKKNKIKERKLNLNLHDDTSGVKSSSQDGMLTNGKLHKHEMKVEKKECESGKFTELKKQIINSPDGVANDGSEQSSKSKKKRKRKCKRNKFKDYSKETDAAGVSVLGGSGEKGGDDNGTNEMPGKKGVSSSNTSGPNRQNKQKSSDVVVSGKSNAKKVSELTKVNIVTNKQKTKNSLSSGRETDSKLKLDPKVLSNLLADGKKMGMKKQEKVSSDEEDEPESVPLTKPGKGKLKPKTLLEKNRERLNAARFRYLNEQMYTSTGNQALKMFQDDEAAFHVYHEGFQSQVEKWPTNPLDIIIEELKQKPKNLVVADFGCGDAKLAKSVENKVYSFDLVAMNSYVTACDMSKVPIPDSSVHVAVFCLSLMGTNLVSYLKEANRVLKQGGLLKIAEVSSRFDNTVSFVRQVQSLGFKVLNQDMENKMFVRMDFRKVTGKKGPAVQDISLNPCVYKKR